jgi:hypothetical protein
LSTGTARSTRFARRRHRNLVAKPRYSGNQHAHFALAGNDHFAIFTALEHGFKAVQP